MLMASPFLPPNESNWAITVVKEHTEKAQTTDSKRIRRNMELITKGRMTAKVQSKLVELVSIVKLIENLLFSPKIPKFMVIIKGKTARYFLRKVSISATRFVSELRSFAAWFWENKFPCGLGWQEHR